MEVLKHAEIKTIGDLVEWSEKRLLGRPNMGQASLNILKEILAEIDIELPKK